MINIGQTLNGSLFGMNAIKKVTMACIGKFNRNILIVIIKENICYIVRLINQTMTKVGFIEPNFLNEKLFDHQIKNTLGLTEL